MSNILKILLKYGQGRPKIVVMLKYLKELIKGLIRKTIVVGKVVDENVSDGSKRFILETIAPRCTYLRHYAINTVRLITAEYVELHFRRKYLSSNIS